MKLFKRHSEDNLVTQPGEDLTQRIISTQGISKDSLYNPDGFEQEEKLAKAYNAKTISYVEPIKSLGAVDFRGGIGYKSMKDGIPKSRQQILKQASKNIIVNAIITARSNQVAQFAQPARLDPNGVGFEVVPKDSAGNPNSNISKADEERIKEIEDFLHYTRNKQAPEANFRKWARQVVRDILTYDQTNTEITYDRHKHPIRFDAVDASTVYYASRKDGSAPTGKNENKYVQIIDDTVAVGFKPGELTFDVMNPRTDINSYRYGLSPLEVSLSEVGYHDMTEDFNAKYFSQGGTTMGVLQIKTGDGTTAAALEDFRRDFTNSFGGVAGAWRIPVISADDVKYINMNQSSRDMQFESWLSYLINAISSNFQIDAQEVGFQTKGIFGKSGNSLQEASRSESIELSQNKGLKPLLDFIEDIINFNIMPNFYGGKFIFRFRGDDLKKRQQELAVIKDELATYKGLNEVRAEKGLGPVAIIGDDIPLNPILIQRLGQLQAQENADRDFAYQEKRDKIADKQAKDAMKQHTQANSDSDNAGSEGNQLGTEHDINVTTQDNQKAQAGKVVDNKTDPSVKKDGSPRTTK